MVWMETWLSEPPLMIWEEPFHSTANTLYSSSSLLCFKVASGASSFLMSHILTVPSYDPERNRFSTVGLNLTWEIHLSCDSYWALKVFSEEPLLTSHRRTIPSSWPLKRVLSREESRQVGTLCWVNRISSTWSLSELTILIVWSRQPANIFVGPLHLRVLTPPEQWIFAWGAIKAGPPVFTLLFGPYLWSALICSLPKSIDFSSFQIRIPVSLVDIPAASSYWCVLTIPVEQK